MDFMLWSAGFGLYTLPEESEEKYAVVNPCEEGHKYQDGGGEQEQDVPRAPHSLLLNNRQLGEAPLKEKHQLPKTWTVYNLFQNQHND